MSISALHEDVLEIVNELEDQSSLVAKAAKRAKEKLERRHTFSYMRNTEMFQFGSIPTNSTQVLETVGVSGVGDVQLSNSVADGSIQLSWLVTDFTAAFPVGTFVRLGGVGSLSVGMVPMALKYGLVTESTYTSIVGGNLTILIDDSGAALASQIQPASFVLQKIRGNPFTNVASADPGILIVGERLKSVPKTLQICSATDYRRVLRKVKRLLPSDTDAEDESWDGESVGDIPAGYFFAGRGSGLGAQIKGNLVIPGSSHVLIFRPIPNDNYWVRGEFFRYTDWPVSDRENHPLLDTAHDLLVAATIVELAPALRDKDLVAFYAGEVAEQSALLAAADEELEESDATDSMGYDPYAGR